MNLERRLRAFCCAAGILNKRAAIKALDWLDEPNPGFTRKMAELLLERDERAALSSFLLQLNDDQPIFLKDCASLLTTFVKKDLPLIRKYVLPCPVAVTLFKTLEDIGGRELRYQARIIKRLHLDKCPGCIMFRRIN